MSEPVQLTPVPMPMYLKPEEAGELMRLSAKSVYRLVKDPTFPAVKLGAGRNATIRIPRARLLAWLEERTQGAPAMRRRMRPSSNPASDHEVGRA